MTAIELNPEFRRNLWLELTPQRLIAVPLVIGLSVAAGWLSSGPERAGNVAHVLLWALLAVWGSRLAADALVDEVVGHTWENQRMTALGAWSMTWGKLFGGTIVTWYGALWCVAVIAVAGTPDWSAVGQAVLYSLLAQSLALLFGMLVLQLHDGSIRAHVSVAQAASLLLTVGVHQVATAGGTLVTWYHFDINRAHFGFASLVVAVVWTTLGIWRLMRTEMLTADGPGFWFAFTLFAACYAGGFSRIVDTPALILVDATQQQLVAAFLVMIALTYLAAFLAPKRYARLRRLIELVRSRQWRAAWPLLPPWCGSLALAILLCVVFPATALGNARPFASTGALIVFLLACLLFTLRDLGLILSLTLDAQRSRGHIAALVYLSVLYGLVPLLFEPLGWRAALPVLLPMPDAAPAMALGPVFLEAAASLVVLRLRVARLGR